MENVTQVDEEGNKWNFIRYRGHVFIDGFPKDPETRFDAMEKFKCRDDDVFIISYPKSGLHWVNNIVTMMTSGTLNYAGHPKMLEYEDLEDFNKMASPRVIGFHSTFSMLPEDLRGNKGRIIRVIRNPKDACVSYYEFGIKLTKEVYRGNFNGMFRIWLSENCFYGNWFHYEKDWYHIQQNRKDLKILVLKYEDLKKDIMKNLKDINKYLQLNRSEEFLKEIAQNVIFEKLKADHESNSYVGADWTEFMKKSAGFMQIYRKGMVGDWKNYFTVAQNEYFDKEYALRMKGCDLDLTFE